jgi:probable phosphoglycerate mutase
MRDPDGVAHPELWLARHGQTDWSSAGKHTGRTDIPLNADGRAAAQKLGTILAGHDFELVLTSPLARARETCELAGFGESAEIDADLREWDYGDYEGLTTVQIREHRPGWTVFADGCPGGETLDAVAARADHVIERVRRVEGNALVFGHGHALRILAARWIDLEPAAGAHLALETATVSLLGWERETPAISRWNVSDGG